MPLRPPRAPDRFFAFTLGSAPASLAARPAGTRARRPPQAAGRTALTFPFHSGRPLKVVAALLLLLAAGSARTEAPSLGHPGYLILVGAADSTAGYHWRDGPGPGQRSLVWEHGLLTVPATLALEGFGPRDLAVAVGAGLTGTSDGGELVFSDGRYRISAPLLLSDPNVSFYAAAGELELVGQRIRYLPPQVGGRADPRAGFVFLAGMVVLVVVLMRLARRRRGEGGRR